MNTTSIRIIGGRNKSYRIVFKASPALRPTSDRAKETLFSWLQFEIENKSCLDLFAGTGGLGFEALSRGAQYVTFVERDKSLYKNILKKEFPLKKLYWGLHFMAVHFRPSLMKIMACMSQLER